MLRLGSFVNEFGAEFAIMIAERTGITKEVLTRLEDEGRNDST